MDNLKVRSISAIPTLGFFLVISLFWGVTSIGCHSMQGDSQTITAAPARYKVSFNGIISPKFIGTWKDKQSGELVLNKDGTALIVAVDYGPGGKTTHKLKGKWLVDQKNLLLQYSQGQAVVTLKNHAALSGKNLTLIQAGNHYKTSYTRS